MSLDKCLDNGKGFRSFERWTLNQTIWLGMTRDECCSTSADTLLRSFRIIVTHRFSRTFEGKTRVSSLLTQQKSPPRNRHTKGWHLIQAGKRKIAAEHTLILCMLAVIAQILARTKRFQSTFLTSWVDSYRPLWHQSFWTALCSQAERAVWLGWNEENDH